MFLDAQQLVVRIGQVLPLGDARQAHEMLEGLRPLPAGKVRAQRIGRLITSRSRAYWLAPMACPSRKSNPRVAMMQSR